MTDADKKLDKEFGVIEQGLKITEKDLEINPVSGRQEIIASRSQEDWGDVKDVDRDYEYQRQNFYNLVER